MVYTGTTVTHQISYTSKSFSNHISNISILCSSLRIHINLTYNLCTTKIFKLLNFRYSLILRKQFFVQHYRQTGLISLRWCHNGRDSVSNHQPQDCLLNRLFRRRSKKTSKLRITGLCAGNSPGTGEFPAQMASYAEIVCIRWRHHVHETLIRT